MRVVLDTNVLVSALAYPGGAPDQVYEHALADRYRLVTSPSLLLELARVLDEKLGRDPRETEDALREIVQIALVVEPAEAVSDVRADTSDNRVLEAAAAGQADLIVTGDRHVLALGVWRGIPIIKPAELLARLDAADGEPATP